MSSEALFRRKRWKSIVFALLLILIASIVVSLNLGFAQLPFTTVVKALAKKLPFLGGWLSVPGVEETIITEIRLPRVLAGVVVGMALSLAGSIFQGIFRNPMADPYVIGTSAGAAFGASLAIVLGLGAGLLGVASISLMAFLGATLTVSLVYSISRVGARTPVTMLLLSGIAVSTFLSALVMVLGVLAGEKLHALYFWLLGGFSYVEWVDVLVAAPLILAASIVSYFYSRDLNVMQLGEEQALQLGVEVERSKLVLTALGSLATSAAVAISGLIGFVGLIIPHLVRLLVGPDHRVLIPASMLTGGSLLALCDGLARTIGRITFLGAPTELPVGVVTAIMGAPFFLYLLRRRRGEYGL